MSTQFILLFFIWASLTCLSSTASSEFSVTSQKNEFPSDTSVVELFQQWKDKHGKVYKHEKEAEERFKKFKDNLRYIKEKNSERRTSSEHFLGLTKFADMSNEEFKQVYISKVENPRNKKIVIERRRSMQEKKAASSCKGPSAFDWRKHGIVTPVKDQGSCGSCWAFSSTGAIEGINALVTGDLISLSEQELVDCDTTNEGCDGGVMDYAFEWIISNGGIDTESNYPYTGIDGTCNIVKEETRAVSIEGFTDVEEEESALFCAVLKQPVSAGIDGGTLDFQLYSGGIYDGDCSSNPNDIDHAVLIVGYDAEGDNEYWIVKNSWGVNWGIDGYIYIRRNTTNKFGACGINAMASYPTKSSSPPSPHPSPTVPPPPPPQTPPPTPPSECGDFSYCQATETCCCALELFDLCLVYGCCEYSDAVCCTSGGYCCPGDYPICDIDEGLCFQKSGDTLGLPLKKRKMAKHKFPWTRHEQEETDKQQVLEWKRKRFAAIH